MSHEDYKNVKEIGIFYDYIRPKGYRLNTFGGTASGHEPLKEMFVGIEKVIHNQLDPSLEPLEKVEGNKVKLRPVHILDIGNLIGNNVVVGGVRRTAEIFLFDGNDYESMFAKYGLNGIWNEEKHKEVIQKARDLKLHAIADRLEKMPVFDPKGTGMNHRRMSNNSIAFTEKPTTEYLDLVFTMMEAEGEPGFINMEEASRRRPNARGINPCAEILLDSYSVCNLTTINVTAFVKDGELDMEKILEAQELSVQAGLNMTLADLELSHWDAVQKRDRLLGASMTGFKDAMYMIDADESVEKAFLNKMGTYAREQADKKAKAYRVNSPLLVTTVKPEGTISQLCGSVSSGLHMNHAPYFLRRVRINAADPLAKVVNELGWTTHAEVGTDGFLDEESLAREDLKEKARTLVITFPVESGAKKSKDDIDIQEQFDTYFRFQKEYTEHNSSNTISVNKENDEWNKAQAIIEEKWDDFVGVSYLEADGGSYTLAPYKTSTKEEVEAIRQTMAPFDEKLLEKYETGEESDLEGADGCEGGACPIR